MQMADFEYNGERLCDYGLTICNFDSNAEDMQDVGNVVTINKVKSSNSQEYISTGYSYDDVFKAEFQAIKIGCSVVDTIITDIELNRIMRWLNRKKYCIFRPIYEDDNFMNIYFKGTFNIQTIKVGSDVIGLHLTFTANAPFGFMDDITYDYEFKSLEDKFIIHDVSDEVGHIYADAKIQCLESGTLKITNSLDPDNTVIINNCVKGEVITLKGKLKIIESSLPSHSTLPNDFNYRFLRINNTYDDIQNIFKSSIKCKITVSYTPIRKVGLIL